MDAIEGLVEEWRERADYLRRWGAGEELAHVWRLAADELQRAIREANDEVLTLEEAARESGYSKRRLRELVAEGRVPNAGRKHAPRIRRADLPLRPGHRARVEVAGDVRRLLKAS